MSQPILKELPETYFLIVGEGEQEYQEMLRNLTGELKVSDRVVFLGKRPGIQEVIGGFDICVLCSSTEGLPRVFLEGMAPGKPVVSSNVPANRDVVVHEGTGLLYPTGDWQRLAEGIIQSGG